MMMSVASGKMSLVDAFEPIQAFRQRSVIPLVKIPLFDQRGEANVASWKGKIQAVSPSGFWSYYPS